MAASLQPNNSLLQQMLQSAVQAGQCTYSIFWQFCPEQGTLIWVDGYYNGDIKTRKMLQSIEANAEEASGVQRSQQLSELYHSLLAHESNQPPVRRPYVALLPEDLTDLEWFYLLCISFSFPPGVGLPGKAYAKGRHIWLCGAYEVDNKIFSRSILAKSANIQTVVCIPLLNGVVELGFTERIAESKSFIQEVKKIFINHHGHHHDGHHYHPPLPLGPPTPAFPADPCHFPLVPMYAMENPSFLPYDRHTAKEEADHDNFNANCSDLEAETEQKNIHGLKGPNNVDPTEQGELMQLELFDDMQLISSSDYMSDNVDVHTMARPMDHPNQLSYCQADSIQAVKLAQRRSKSMKDQHQQMPSFIHRDSQSSGGAIPVNGLNYQDERHTHYSQIISTILQIQPSSTATSTAIFPISPLHFSSSPNSAFLRWTYEPSALHHPPDGTTQRLLKYVLFTVPSLHAKHKCSAEQACSVGWYPGPSTSHVLAERRRRERLNERFTVLRSLVPFVTKTDKASILGDTIEYLKHLRNKIRDLETRERQMERKRVRLAEAAESDNGFERRKVQVGVGERARTMEAFVGKLEVSIIESDALVELHCPYREGLLLDIMLTLRDLHVEVTAVQSSLHDSYLIADLRAKVQADCKGKKASILEVKSAVKQVMPHGES